MTDTDATREAVTERLAFYEAVNGAREQPSQMVSDVISDVRAALASRGERAAHAADCDCLACDPDPVLDSPLAAPDDWATVEALARHLPRRVGKLAKFGELMATGGLSAILVPRLYQEDALEIIARLRAADQAKTEALRFYAEKRHIHVEWSGERVIRDDGKTARDALAAAAAAPKETT